MVVREGVDDLAALEKAFGIPRGYIDNLKNDDDWSLIIKSHAILESAAANMLCHYFGKYELIDIFAELEMSNKRSGKAAFISALDLLGKNERRFLSLLSELRNLVVHNASNVTFNLRDYIASISAGKRAEFLKGLNIRLKSISKPGKTYEGNELVLQLPNLVIWTSLTWCLHKIYVQDVFAIERNRIINIEVEKLRKHGPKEVAQEKINLTIGSRRTR